jgi:hypothetical protein
VPERARHQPVSLRGTVGSACRCCIIVLAAFFCTELALAVPHGSGELTLPLYQQNAIGPLYTLPACSNLEGCRLGSGQLPDSLADLTSLQYLNLGTNDLQNTLPTAWGATNKFPQLQVIVLARKQGRQLGGYAQSELVP